MGKATLVLQSCSPAWLAALFLVFSFPYIPVTYSVVTSGTIFSPMVIETVTLGCLFSPQHLVSRAVGAQEHPTPSPTSSTLLSPPSSFSEFSNGNPAKLGLAKKGFFYRSIALLAQIAESQTVLLCMDPSVGDP